MTQETYDVVDNALTKMNEYILELRCADYAQRTNPKDWEKLQDKIYNLLESYYDEVLKIRLTLCKEVRH